MKRFLSILLCLMMVLSLFAGCGEQDSTQGTDGTTGTNADHKHTFDSTKWETDDTSHWYAANCGHELKSNLGDHVDDNKDGDCDICAWKFTCEKTSSKEHEFSKEWSSDETHHWYSAICMHYGAVSEKAEHVDENNDGECDVCAYTGDHTHSYVEEWTTSDTQHWHVSDCGHDVVGSLGDHVDYNLDGICDTCAWYDESHEHTYSEEWDSDVAYHWHAANCEHIGAKKDQGEHADTDGDDRCDTCNYNMCNHVDYDVDGQCDLCGWSDPNHTHEYGEMGADKSGHWYVATCHPGAVSETEAHVDTNNDGVCDVCEFQTCAHSFSAEWTSDETHHWHDILCTCFIPRKDYEEHTFNDLGECTVCMYGAKVPSVYETVIDEEPFVIVMDKMITWAEFTVNFPQPGRYVLYPNNEEVKICTANDGTGTPTQSSITLDIEEAGEMTLWFRIFDFGYYAGKEWPITYSVIRMDDLVIDTLKGKVELPTNTTYTLHFVAPEVGTYKLTTSVDGLVIGLTHDSMEYFKGHITLEVTEVGQQFTFYIELNDLNRKSFIFDWILEPPFYLDVQDEGNYAISVTPKAIDYKVVFTAPVAGYYSLSVDSEWLTFCYWNEDLNQPVRGDGDVLAMSEVLTGWLEAGQTYTTWIQTAYDYPDSVDVHDVLTVTNIGQMVEMGDNTLTPGAEGSKYSIQANGTSYYCLSATNGEIGVIGAGGAVTWTDYYEVKIAHGESYSFLVRGEAEVTLGITRTTYEFMLNEGDNTVTMVPAKEYNVTINPKDADSNSKVILKWNNPRLLVYVNGVQYQPGAEIEMLHSADGITMTVYSNANVDVEINVEIVTNESELVGEQNATLTLNQQATLLILGTQSATAEFTAEYGGTYTFQVSSEDQNTNTWLVFANGDEQFLFPGNGTYEIQLEAGETVTFRVASADESTMNAYVIMSSK